MTEVRSCHFMDRYKAKVPELYNLDDEDDCEGRLEIDLPLDQMES
ncbi:MAG: hypothetical protein QXL67_02890 [Candidatus Bathyarchaeia archaeon]